LVRFRLVAHEQIDSILKQTGLTYDWPPLGHTVAGTSFNGASVFGASYLGNSAFGPFASRGTAPYQGETELAAAHEV